MYTISEVDGVLNRGIINEFNSLDEYFPPLQDRHFSDGFWWLAYHVDEGAVAFAGLVPFSPFNGYGYLKRCLIKPGHFGHGLQFRFMCLREVKAKQLAFTHLVSECLGKNEFSCRNFQRAGFEQFEPEQKWGEPNSIYWLKAL